MEEMQPVASANWRFDSREKSSPSSPSSFTVQQDSNPRNLIEDLKIEWFFAGWKLSI